MFKVVLRFFLFAFITDIAYSGFIYRADIKGWIMPYKVLATYEEASQRCYALGAVVASPINVELLNTMKSIIGQQKDPKMYYFIGTSARFSHGQFVSEEGYSLEDMPDTPMVEKLDTQVGQCLAMNIESIRAVTCASRLPYFCYKRQLQATENMHLNECGTYDEEYELNTTTGSCYKYHMEPKTWDEAYTICTREGAYLAILNDEIEAKLHTDKIVDKKIDLYIGLRDLKHDNNWRTIHGQPIEEIYNVWWHNSKRVFPPRHCGYLDTYTGKLDDYDCNIRMSFVCEKDPSSVRFPPSQQTQTNILLSVY